jgi:transcriptional regulator with XRE-family HTH domain
MIATTFGTAMRSYRVAARITYRGLLDASGLSISYLHDIEHGKRRAPAKAVCERIIDAIADRSKMPARKRVVMREAMLQAARADVVHGALLRWETGAGADTEEGQR